MSSGLELLKILYIIRTHGEIRGRTRFQKLVFLLKYKYNVPFDFQYTSYFYGPYSYDLSEYLDSLLSYDLISETRIHLGTDVDRYDYSLTQKGSEFIDKFEKAVEDNNEFERIREAIQKMDDESTPHLVRTAKKLMRDLMND